MILRPILAPTRTLAAAVALAALGGLPAATAPSLAAATTLKPVDEARKDKSFLRFRAQLMKIVERRDLKALRRHLHPNVKVSFGTGNGIDAAVKMMRGNPKRWAVLARLLRQGGKFTMTGTASGGRARMFFAPYTYFAELPGGIGAYDVVTVVGERVNVRARPNPKAEVIAKLSHKVVKVDWGKAGPRNQTWTKIKLPDGRSGYVLAKYARSPVDYRAGFVKVNGRWMMRVFVAGD